MKLFLQRGQASDIYTEGQLYINGVWFCFTLEDADRNLENGGVKIHGKTAIPRGLYKVIIDYSQRFKKLMLHVLDVPGFVGIRIHAGNTHVDTDGCILVGGTRISPGRIGNSAITSHRLMILCEEALDRGEDLTLEVV